MEEPDYKQFIDYGFEVLKTSSGRYTIKPVIDNPSLPQIADALNAAEKQGFIFGLNLDIVGYKKPEKDDFNKGQ